DFGQTWLQQFNGGLMTTCGLTHVGPPEKDDVTGEWRDIHGRYSRLRAQDIWVDEIICGGWKEDENGGQVQKYFDLALQATIHQSALFGEQLRLERMIRQTLTAPEIQISDTITNLGDRPIPVMLLYHTNFGFPIIQGGSRLYTPFEKVYPRDANAKVGRDNWATYEAASPEYPEQVFYHHLKAANNKTGMLLTNEAEDFGIYLKWDTRSLPYLSQWKNTRQGMYVCGIEPGNCIPEGLNAARKNNRLTVLKPGEKLDAYWDLRVLDSADLVKTFKTSILNLQARGQSLENCRLDDYAQFAE
ncbi:MAG TPA: aldose 1-epimerase family protein, partial [Terriglobales bacterium]|nr:aldose 1-epimerase family protein [Terriglobales bacterium]